MKIKRLPIFILFLCTLFILVINVHAMINIYSLIFLPIVQKQVPQDTPTPTLSPTLSPTPGLTITPPPITGNIVITNIFYNGSGNTEPDEYVEIRNNDTFPIQLANWTLRDQANHIFTFPNFIIQVNQVCRIYTNQSHPEWCGFNYGYGTAIWNNTGDCGYLRNSNSTLIDDYCY